MIAHQKLRKMLFISSKKLFCSRDIQFFVFRPPLFPPLSATALKDELKVTKQ